MLQQKNLNANTNHLNKTTKPNNLLQKSISQLKQQNSALKLDIQSLKEKLTHQRNIHEKEVNGLKKKISELNEKQIVDCLVRKQKPCSEQERVQTLESKNKQLKVQLEERAQETKKLQQIIGKCKHKILSLSQEIKQVKIQKEKNMELSILQKMSMEDKISLLMNQVDSKKTIIESLSKELDKQHFYQADLRNKERKLIQKSKELQTFQRQYGQYFQTSEHRLLERIKGLQNENVFLKKKVKQILKKLKRGCKCEGEAAQWKSQVYELGRQLVRARVQLGKVMFSDQRAQQKRKDQKPKNKQIDSSMDSLSLSENSEEQLSLKTPKNTTLKHTKK